MVQKPVTEMTACVVGLGYVGLPLAKAFAEKIRTIGYEIVEAKAKEIAATSTTPLIVTSDPALLRQADFVAICVPTPVMKTKEPDLSYVKSAATIVGQNLKLGAIVVLESTVYPGVTEDIVMPILEQESGLICGKDFKVGYSPERINPGDDAHELAKITKIVAGMDAESGDTLSEIYSLVTTVYRAPDIRTAEAAKVIENIQRDLNIALMNELALVFHKMGIDTREVIKAAGTKWNFHQYRPGLVGGHCIPVDPYYLVYKAQELGYHPQVILAGRAINDSIPKHVADLAIKEINRAGKVIRDSKVLIMGLTYKENVPDTRESPVAEMIRELKEFDVDVYGYDPLLRSGEIERFGAQPIISLHDIDGSMDCIIINSPHDVFASLTLNSMFSICNGRPIIIDVTGMLKRNDAVTGDYTYCTL
ncbi:nucleotide sugar dehydrogenase [Methanogenium sp. S4BF]|uniref:nucleotide sugar dehydrogenase n=1 Tax=Methanogenium sp. S4BF TaxID=1789226 RepID=UPI0024165188|nr:nucleotide sugar dehydrogenase [Methanogenium sp. S4BF]WFN34990.1 nucleotide sugar dehydrogenase [Methanogenium sp. S4BF]